MAFGTRVVSFNSLDSSVGTEYSPGGGNAPIALNNSDGYELEGTGCGEFRIDSEVNTIKGWTQNPASSVDLSSSGSAAIYWFNTSVGATLTDYDFLMYDGTTDGLVNIGTGFYPGSGGYIPIWCDASQLSATITLTAVTTLGFRISNGNAGSGNKVNSFVDSSSYFQGTQVSPFFLNGTTDNTLAFVRSTETNKTGGFRGLLTTSSGIDFFYSRLTVGEGATAGTAVATTFSASDNTIIFVDQPGITSTWLGWSVNLGNASTTFSLSNSNFQSSNVSGATNRPDLVFSGTAGTATITDCAVLGLRDITFTSACSVNGGTLDGLSLTQATAEIKNAELRARTAAGVAFITDGSFGTTGIHDCTIIQKGSGHAFELTSTTYTTTTTIAFEDIIFDTDEAFGANGTTSAAIHNSSGQAITININGLSTAPTVRNTNGSTTTIVQTKTLSIANIEEDTELRVYTYTDLNDPTTYTELVGAENIAATPTSSTFATVAADSNNAGNFIATFLYDSSGGALPVVVVAHNLNFEFFRIQETLSDIANTNISLFQSSDRQYDSGSV